ncbi:MAG: formylglycine-generating enzyme family protein [Clostridia bacterium]|nr:formylglycine-generating enzyme family protein [Clostridia bacterium]
MTGENGILTKASKAKEDTELATAREKVQMVVLASYDSNGDLDIITLKTELKKIGNNVTDTNEGFPVTVTVDGYTFVIDRQGNATGGDESNLPEVYEPAKLGEIVTGTNKSYTKNGTAIIPVGFAVVPGCDDVSNGLVISDDGGDTEINSNNKVANGNQFVWVPVEDISVFKRVDGYYGEVLQGEHEWFTDIFSSSIEPYSSTTEQKEYDTMKSSIEKYKGFYIGRYEVGKDNNENAVVKKQYAPYITKWGNDMSSPTEGAVMLARNFANSNGYEKVTSTLCYGVQWDATMQFFDNNYINGSCSANSYVRNSKDKGNYGHYDDRESLILTGSNENYCIKNIYDMAGNTTEWTMEVFKSTQRVTRGGWHDASGYGYSVSSRIAFSSIDTNDKAGFRITLYL